MNEIERTLRVFELMDNQRFDVVADLLAPGFMAHIGAHALPADAWLGMGRMFYDAFPDGQHTIEDKLQDGDRVVVRGRWTGTHTAAAFQGIPAAGRRVEITFFSMQRHAEGRVAEHWALFDALTMMQQLGVVPVG